MENFQRREELKKRYQFFLEDLWLKVTYNEKFKKTELIKHHKVNVRVFSAMKEIGITTEKAGRLQVSFVRTPPPVTINALLAKINEKKKGDKGIRRKNSVDKILCFLEELLEYNTEKAYLKGPEVMELIKKHKTQTIISTVLLKKQIVRLTDSGYYIPMFSRTKLTREFGDQIAEYIRLYRLKLKERRAMKEAKKQEKEDIELRAEPLVKNEIKEKPVKTIVRKRSLLEEVELMIRNSIKEEVDKLLALPTKEPELRGVHQITLPKGDSQIKKIVIEFEEGEKIFHKGKWYELKEID